MAVYNLVNAGSSYLGRTFHNVRDIYTNGIAYSRHNNFVRAKEKTLTKEECQKLGLALSDRFPRSDLYIFRNYFFELKKSDDQYRVKISPLYKEQGSIACTFVAGSLSRLAKGVTITSLAILTSPIWATALTGVYLHDSRRCTKEIIDGFFTKNEVCIAEDSKACSNEAFLERLRMPLEAVVP